MQPFRAIGLTMPLVAGTALPITMPLSGNPPIPTDTDYPQANSEATTVLVSNMNTGDSDWGYFSAMDSEPDDTTWPPVITTTDGVTTTTNPPLKSGLGIPIPPGSQLLIAISPSVTYYLAQGIALLVTPVEMLKTQ